MATCVLIDYLIEKNISLNVSSITLIEPSTVALQRGQSLVQRMFQNNPSTDSVVRLVNKYIDDLTSNDLVSEPDSIKIHLFSNIIDVQGFDLTRLYQLMVNSFHGINRVICTSPYNEGQQRLETSTISFRLTKLLERLAQVNQSREKFSMLKLEATRSLK